CRCGSGRCSMPAPSFPEPGHHTGRTRGVGEASRGGDRESGGSPLRASRGAADTGRVVPVHGASGGSRRVGAVVRAPEVK
ncbi:hypothetical protein, partial [Salmonella sp. hn-h2]|uniref:hypothetical protein n=1 Tax=Salmonella sp. hn-h2 TaxID=2582611 RepID=UPI001F3F373A